jgi:hypothetical protein
LFRDCQIQAHVLGSFLLFFLFDITNTIVFDQMNSVFVASLFGSFTHRLDVYFYILYTSSFVSNGLFLDVIS